MTEPAPLLDRHWFWMAVLTFSVVTLAFAVFAETGRTLFVVATIIGHAELLVIGEHLVRTRHST